MGTRTINKKPLKPEIVELWAVSLKEILGQLDELRADQNLLKESGKPHKRWQSIAEDVSWHRAYELPPKKALLVYAPRVISGITIGSVFIPEEMPETLSTPQKSILKVTIEALMILEGNIQSFAANACSVHSLVSSVANGDDNAYFSALKADPATLRCAPLQRRYQKALSSFDNAFIRRTGRTLAYKPVSEEKRDFGRFRLVCWLMNQISQLDRLTMKSAAYLFIEELKLYSQSGDDPVGSLWTEIQRTKERLDNN